MFLQRALSFDAPEEFWQQKGELAAVEIRPAAGDSLYEAFHVELASSAGWRVRGHLRAPRRAGRWPSIIIVGGVNTGRMAAELINPEKPYVILGLDYPWEGSTELTWWEFLPRVLAVRHAMLLTPPAIFLAIDYLQTRQDVDASGPVLVGASFGAQLITVAGALDERAGAVLSIYGGGDYAAILEANLKNVKPALLRRLVARTGAWLLAPVEPLDYASLIAPRPMIIINGSRDDRVPLASVEGLYDAAQEPKQLIWLDEGHISSRDPALLGRVLEAATRALARHEAESASSEDTGVR